MRRLGAEITWKHRATRIALRAAYWLAVLAISIGILIALILFLESRDSSQVGHGARLGAAPVHARRVDGP